MKKILVSMLVFGVVLIFAGCAQGGEPVDDVSASANQAQISESIEEYTIMDLNLSNQPHEESHDVDVEKETMDITDDSCSLEENPEAADETAISEPTQPWEIIFRTGIDLYQHWRDGSAEFPIEIDAIPDKETAIDVATAIFRSMQRGGRFINYEVMGVFYDEEDEVWIVSFSDDWGPGNDCSIALRKSDAKVLAIWVGE